MKPVKNKVFCRNCNRSKMLFETEKKANNFIKFNQDEIKTSSGYAPQRSYYCVFCGGWHTTNIKHNIGISKNEEAFEKFQIQDKENACLNYEKNRSLFLLDLKIKTLNMSDDNIIIFLNENIKNVNSQIEDLIKSNNNVDKQLKITRQHLQLLYCLRKNYKKTKCLI